MIVLERKIGIKVKGKVGLGWSWRCVSSVEMGVVPVGCLYMSAEVWLPMAINGYPQALCTHVR